jgi:CelD/BcsL family acetyltransferase involved in cellulose biosynthesis
VYVRCIDNWAELDRYRNAWEALAEGSVFRSWTWLRTWWRHYGEPDARRELRVYLAFSDVAAGPESLAAVLPCYVEASWTQGRVLRLLGDGEVCSDHLGLLVKVNAEQGAAAIATYLAESDDWDLLDLAAVDSDDAITTALLDVLALNDCTTTRLLADRCWVIDLPPTWGEFLAMQSKSHRKQLRQLDARVLQSERAKWKLVTSPAEFASAWSTLVDLHQRRRISLGEPGCFASRTWAAFHWEVAQQLLAEGRLRLSLLDLDSQPIAAEYHLAGAGATYAYQGGVEPERLADEPGQLSTLCTIKQAIADGHAHFDLLRGDEPYKAHWRAVQRQALRLVAVPPRMWPKLRHKAWKGARGVAHATRQFSELLKAPGSAGGRHQ